MKKSLANNLIKNSAASFIYEATLVIIGLIVPWYILNYFGSEVNGLISSIGQVVVNIAVVELGLGMSISYALYKPLIANDHAAVSSIVSAGRKSYIRTGFVFTGMLFAAAVIFMFTTQAPGVSTAEVGMLVIVIGFSTIVDFFTLAKYRAIFTADKRGYIIRYASTLFKVCEAALIVIMTIQQVNIATVRAVALLAIIPRSIIIFVCARKRYPHLDVKAEPNSNAIAGRWNAMAIKVSEVVRESAPVLMLTFLVRDLALVSVYAVYNMVIRGIKMVFDVLVSGGIPVFGEIIASDDRQRLQKAYFTYQFTYYFLMTFAYAVCGVMILSFIRLYTAKVHDINYVIPIYGYLFTLTGITHNIKAPQSHLIFAAGKFKETRHHALIHMGIVLAAGAVLSIYFGVVGILVALFAGNTYRTIVLVSFIPKHVTYTTPWKTVKRIAFVFGQILTIWTVFYVIDIKISSYSEWILLAVIVSVVTLALITVTAWIFERQELYSILRRIKDLFKRKKKT